MNTPMVSTDNDPDLETAHRILNALIVKGVDQKALAQATGISLSTLRRSLDQKRPDRRSLTIQQLGLIASALEVPAAILLPAELTQDAA